MSFFCSRSLIWIEWSYDSIAAWRSPVATALPGSLASSVAARASWISPWTV
jgi:hypothetical protein